MFNVKLHPGEKLVAMYRQTEMVLVKSVFVVFALIFIPLYFLIRYELVADYHRLAIFWSILVLLYFGRKYLLWLLNVFLLTDHRLILVTYKGLLFKTVTETPLDRVSNIGFTSKGLIDTLFQVGAIKVEVLGLAAPLEMRNIKHPAEVKDALWQVHRAAAIGGFAKAGATPFKTKKMV